MKLIRGVLEIYFNAHAAMPFVWCVAVDGVEYAVSSVKIRVAALSAEIVTEYRPHVERKPDHSGPPSAVLRGRGQVTIGEDGAAIVLLAA